MKGAARGRQWALSHRRWNKLMHILHGNTAAPEPFAEVFGEEPVEDDFMLEMTVSVDGYYRMMPILVLWRAEDGSAAVAVPSWGLPDGEVTVVPAQLTDGADLADNMTMEVKFVTLGAACLARCRPCSTQTAPWKADLAGAWPRFNDTLEAAVQLEDAPPEFLTAGSGASTPVDGASVAGPGGDGGDERAAGALVAETGAAAGAGGGRRGRGRAAVSAGAAPARPPRDRGKAAGAPPPTAGPPLEHGWWPGMDPSAACGAAAGWPAAPPNFSAWSHLGSMAPPGIGQVPPAFPGAPCRA